MTTKLKQYSVKLGAGSKAQRPGSPVEGDIRFNVDNNTYEVYRNNAYGTDGWFGIGGRHLICRKTLSNAWTSVDLTWGTGGPRYAFYEVSCLFADAATSNNRYWQLRWRHETGIDSGSDYGTAIGFHAANDGWDLAHQNNRLDSNPTSRNFISPTNTSYNLQSTAEDHYHMQCWIANSPTGTHEQKTILGWWSGRTENRTGGGQFAGIYRQDATDTQRSTNGSIYWRPVTGCRIYISGDAMRNTTRGINAVICVYGVTGFEERDMG